MIVVAYAVSIPTEVVEAVTVEMTGGGVIVVVTGPSPPMQLGPTQSRFASFGLSERSLCLKRRDGGICLFWLVGQRARLVQDAV